MARIASTSSRMRAAGADHGIEKRRSMCGLIWLPEPEVEAAARERLQVPGLGGERHRAAGEGDGDGGGQLEALGGVGGQHQRQERIVRALEGEGAVVAGRLHRPSRVGHLGERRVTRGPSTRIARPYRRRLGYRSLAWSTSVRVVVARRAPELARAAGSTSPTTSRCGRWPGADPTSRPVPGEPEELGRLLEASLRRRRAPPAGRALHAARAGRRARRAGARGHATARRSAIPACGGGALLLAAARASRRRG